MTTEQIARPREAAAPCGRARTSGDQTPAEAPSSDAALTLSGEAVAARVTTLEWILYSAVTIIGAIMRFWDLGSRALHHDESLHATYSWYLWEKLTGANPAMDYHYDPMMHGPYQFHGNALMFLIFGVSVASARLNAAICGTALIILPILLRRQLGRVASLILSGLLAFSPAYLYYSRFTREDIYFALWTAVFFVGFIRWLDARGRPGGHRWLYMAAAGFALSWATKESTYFTIIISLGFIIGVFAVAYAYQFLAPSRPRDKHRDIRESELTATLGSFSRANMPPLLAAFRGTPPRAWGISAAIIAAITIFLFWPIGDPWQWGFIPGAHPQGTTNALGHPVSYNTDAFTGGLSYWVLQQDVARGGQPWYYYFLVIPLYEQVAVVFGAAGLVYYLVLARRRTRLTVISGAAFVVFALLTLFVGPGLSKLPQYGLALLMVASGVALLVSQPRSLLVNLLLWWTVVTWALYIYAGEKMPWLTLHLLLPTFFVAALFAGHLLQAPRRTIKWLVTVGLLVLTSLISFRSSVALAYADGANPTEMLVYTQTSQDVPNASAVIHRIPTQVSPQGGQVHVWIDGADTWPWVWYLHDDTTNHGFQGSDSGSGLTLASQGVIGAAQQRYPAIVVGSEDHSYLVNNNKLTAFVNYTPYEFKLRWWFPEDGYKAWETTGLSGFLSDALRPSTLAHLWSWWANRTPFDQQAFATWANTYRFFVYVRNDMVKPYVPASWDAAHQKALADSLSPAQVEYLPAALTRPVHPALTIDGGALRQPMAVVRDAAVDASGNIYVLDSAAQRVVKIDRTGRYLISWGGAGTGRGQFSNISGGPMGIAAGPNGHVYVSDTWNHRVEEFTPAGVYVRSFGHANPSPAAPPAADSFYGPRQLAVASNGDIYVADTGNERIQVYSPAGAHLFNFGAGSHQLETALGRFDEPSGVAVDKHGIVYVADYWDRRIQRFTLRGTPLSAYPIQGWAAGDYGEPYLAVDNAGHLFATDAPASINVHVNHILEMNAATGTLIKAFGVGSPAAGSLAAPSGITVGSDGALYIADAGTVRLLKVQVQP